MKKFSDESFRTDWLVMPNKDSQGYSCFYFVGLLTVGGIVLIKLVRSGSPALQVLAYREEKIKIWTKLFRF